MSAGTGVVTVRFDVQGSEQLIAALKSIATSSKGTATSFTEMQTKLNAPMGGLGPLQNLSAGITTAEAKVTSFKTKLAGIGSQLGQNATSFGVATASIWGVYNAYDSLEKVQIRAHSAAVRVSTLETTLASLIERRRIAMEKGNLTSEQMSVLNERISNTQEKLNVAQERNADIAQDLQEAWAGFLSQVGPQLVAAGGSITQLFSVLTQKGPEGISAITKLKTSFTSLFSSIGGASGGALGGISSLFTRMKTSITGVTPAMGMLDGAAFKATGSFSKLKDGLSSIGSFLTSGKGALIGMAGALGLAGAAAFSFFNIMKKGAEAKSLNEVIMTGTASIDQLKKQMENLKAINADWGTQAESFFFSGPLGKAIKPVTTEGMNEELIKGIQAEINVKEVGQTIQGMFDSMQPQPVEFPVDFKLMTPETQANIQAQMQKILAIINNPNNWIAKIDPATGKEIFSAADVRQFSLNALEPLVAGLQETVHSGAFDAYIQRATDGLQKKIFSAMKGAQALTGETGKAATAGLTKAFNLTGFEPGSGTEAAFKKVVERNKLLAASEKEYQKIVEASNKILNDQKNAVVDLNAEDNKLYLTFGGLNRATLTNAEVRAKLLEIQEKQAKGYEKEELNILDIAAANDVYSAELANLAAAEGDHVTQMNNILATSINYTSALDDQAKNQKLVSEGFRDGVIQAKGFFDSLVKGTEQEGVFRAAIADGAKVLGLKADMMAFSTTKMQELITTTYEQSKAYADEALAASKSTEFLKDKVLIQAVLADAQIKGAQAANDWTISMIGSTEAAKAEHSQLLQLAADLLDIPIPISASNEELHKLMTTFEETGDAGLAMAQMMTDQLTPAFERLSGLIQSKDMKELGKNLKEMELPKGFNKDIDDAFKPLQNAAETARKVGNAMDILVVAGENMSKKDLAKNMKAFGDELDRMSKIKGTSEPVDAILDSLKKMTPTQLDSHSKSMQFLRETIDKYGMLPTDKAKEFIDMFNKETPKLGPSAQSAVPGLNSLAAALLKVAETNFDPSKFIPSDTFKMKSGAPVFKDPSLSRSATEVKAPPPIVFPPPDLSNILAGVSKAEIMMSEMVKYAAGLKISFPAPEIGFIALSVMHAQEDIGALVPFVAGLKMSFQPIGIENITSSSIKAQGDIGAVATFITGMKLVFQKPNTQPVTAGATIANAAIKTVETFIKGMKLPFQRPNTDAIISAVGAARKAISTVQSHINSLKLKFPSIDISNINSSVNQAQSKINSLKGTTVTNHVKTVFDNAGGNILNNMMIQSAATGKLFTTNGEQLFRVGDNPGGRETIAIIPHDKPGEIMEKLTKMFPPIQSILHERARKPTMQTVSGHAMTTRTTASPTSVNVTTQVYLFPGSQMFKQYVKQIMLEDVGRYMSA